MSSVCRMWALRVCADVFWMRKYFYMQSEFIFECGSIFMCNPNLFLNAKVLLCVIQIFFWMQKYFCVQSNFFFWMRKYFCVQSEFFFECESIFMCNINLFLNARVLLYTIQLYFWTPKYFYVHFYGLIVTIFRADEKISPKAG